MKVTMAETKHSVEECLHKIRPYLKIKNLRKSDTLKIQLTI